MKVFNRWRRSAAALAAPAAIVPLATASAGAEPVRTATTTTYTRATYLQHALGLPAANTNPVIESVTYDRFQHLLQQSGNFAILIGDPAQDSTFAARAQDVEAAARAAAVKRVYWFNPNLSGNATLGNTTVPNLDIRNPAGITSLSATSQTIYGRAWLNLVGQYLGNGVTATQNNAGTQNATVTATTATTTVNDYGATAGHSTEVGNASGGALYDYSNGSAPADVSDSYFFIYNKANTQGGQPAKIVSWIDLTGEAGSTSTQADVTTAIGTVGASNLIRLDQISWWKSEANSRQNKQSPSEAQGGNVPVVTDSDNAAADGGWRVNQITYAELVDLLKSATDANAVILFGGTWCPNTRAVLSFVNKYAQENDVTVYNFDTVLDGGIVGGGTTSPSNPLQSRNNNQSGANPSFLYGELVSQYLKNLVTEYNPASNGVSYYPGGDTAGTATTVRRLQVPYLIGYQGNPSGGVVRQWIHKTSDTAYKEYMSQWYYTNPQPNQLGLSTIPLDAPIWSTINAQLANFSWRTDPATQYPNTAVDTDDAQYLVGADAATVTYTPANGSTPASVTVASGGANPISISPAALSAALSALGASAPANLAAARTALIAAETATTPDATLISNLRTIAGAWGVAQQRKTRVLSTWGNASTPGSVAGGVAAVRALDLFFGGLPGGVVSRRTVTANPVTYGTAPTIDIAIANDHERKPTGNVSLVVRQGGTTVASASTAVVDDAASFTLPILGAGTYEYTLSYPGDDQIIAFTETGSVTVSPGEERTVAGPPVVVPAPGPPLKVSRVKASKVAGAVSKAPTRKKAGRYKVTITTPKGRSTATGKVTIKLKKGKTTNTITGKLSRGAVTISVPKLARGTWKVTISWPGDASYEAASVTGASIKVKK